ncbi:restriction endonuclease subunit S [Dysgonomonas sp. GY617]|uniref:restriction endonuclease subunit S n=1 Tax=Dysgonomonas sp. GY617 TaxID=2780420 RepID=UPI0018837120|nr:restriction endonuclease subunit S [Dysgonomonas sp. GY617]MBF0577566.1 restriction endonuclease subunit S [Dysgonomonas sp. GY617]
MEEWKETTLENYIKVTNGYAFKSDNFLESEIVDALPVIKIKNVANGDVNINNVQYHLYNESLARYLVTQGDILMALTGNHPDAMSQVVGSASKYKLKKKSVINQRVAKIDTEDSLNKEFLYYFLRDKDTQDYLANQSSGSANQANISKSDIENIPILLPSLPEQKAIADVLSSLDNKIDLLNRQNNILKKKAKTLFRQWFIEEVKEDWEEKPLSSIATFLNGLACQKYPPKNLQERLPVLKIKELNSGFTENSDWATQDIPSEYIVERGDVIFAWSASLMVKIWNGSKCVLNQHLFKVTSADYPKWFYYLWSKYHLDEFIAIAASHATTMGHIKRKDLDNAMVTIPTNEEMNTMDLFFSPLFEKLITNNKQIQTLTSLRDTLLPKLMSGEAQVRI